MDIRLQGTKGLSERPKCTGTERARTHLLLHCIVLYCIVFYTILYDATPNWQEVTVIRQKNAVKTLTFSCWFREQDFFLTNFLLPKN